MKLQQLRVGCLKRLHLLEKCAALLVGLSDQTSYLLKQLSWALYQEVDALADSAIDEGSLCRDQVSLPCLDQFLP